MAGRHHPQDAYRLGYVGEQIALIQVIHEFFVRLHEFVELRRLRVSPSDHNATRVIEGGGTAASGDSVGVKPVDESSETGKDCKTIPKLALGGLLKAVNWLERLDHSQRLIEQIREHPEFVAKYPDEEEKKESDLSSEGGGG